jgi:metal transporter CNNM
VVNSQNEIRLLNSEVGPTADTIGGDIRECKEADDKPVDIPPINYVFMVILAMLSGTFSGLNLGLLGLDVKNLELLTKGPFNTVEEETDAKYALAILPLRRRGNLLLCTILLGNVTVNSGLSILIADFTSGIMGLVVSTAIIVIFGEIIP